MCSLILCQYMGGTNGYRWLVKVQGDVIVIWPLNAPFKKSTPSHRKDHLDYIGWRKDFLQPVVSSPLTVLPIKFLDKMHWDKMATNFPETKGNYRDISDHYPVYAELVFE